MLFRNILKKTGNLKTLNAFAKGTFAKQCKLFNESNFEYTSSLSIASSWPKIPTFRVVDLKGNLLNEKFSAPIDNEGLLKIHETMLKLNEMDQILYMAQRQGKISFYMTSFGEEACSIAVAAALKEQDLVYTQYREQGFFLYRGLTIQELCNQCVGNHEDLGKGRQMPVHYGSKRFNMPTLSSPLATQIPQAAGTGYAFRRNGDEKICVCYFGEGAASEGDFHPALNFAATLRSQTLFICRNNGYAISTPDVDQFAGDGIAPRGQGYGVATLRVDGNDVLAVYSAVKECKDFILKNKKPILLELMSYRVGDHSTSDYSALYRAPEEVQSWSDNNNPISRFENYMKKYQKKFYSEEEIKVIRKKFRDETAKSLQSAIEKKFPAYEELFTDVYDTLTPNLQEQFDELKEHLKVYGDKYNLEKYHKN